MSRVVPRIELVNHTHTNARYGVLLPLLSNPTEWHVFRGFDRPISLIKGYQNLTSKSVYTLPRRLWLHHVARQFIKENDRYFHEDIARTEEWIADYILQLEAYLTAIPDFTHMPWRINKILIYVHAINYAFLRSDASGDSVVLGIRPPEIQRDEWRLYLLIHEYVHANVRHITQSILTEGDFNDAPAEILAVYSAYRVLEKFQENTSIALAQWTKHRLTPKDLAVFTATLTTCTSQTDVLNVFAHDSITEIMSRYRPHEITF